jgi:hypothetical protein
VERLHYEGTDAVPRGINVLTEGSTLKRIKEKARKASHAASAISEAMVKTLTDMQPALAAKYDLDNQLVTLAIAHAAVDVAANAASQATGMGSANHIALEDRLHEVVFDAMNELLST